MPPFTLNRFGDDRGGALADGRSKRLGSLRVHERHRPEQRRERRPVMLVVRHRQRAQRAAGEPALDRDEPGSLGRALRVPVAARELEARLDRFGAAVAEERAREARELRQPRRRLGLKRVVVQVRRVQQRRRLVGDRGREPGMRVAERGDADAGDEVEVLAAVDVVQDARRLPRTNATGWRRYVCSTWRDSRALMSSSVSFHRTTCVQPAAGAVSPPPAFRTALAGRWQSTRRRRPSAARRGTLRAWPPCPCWPCRAIIARRRAPSAARSSGPARRARPTCRRR